jgi:crossover junction endodeoxyribonuclease RuvC
LKGEEVIIGIDPGTSVMGYGIIKVESGKIELLSSGVIKLNKIANHAAKLKRIFERTLGLIETYAPDHMAIEAQFYGKNVQSMLKLGRAQGVAIAAAVYRDIPITEYSPTRIKQSITGNGRASKEQVAAMLGNILKKKDLPIELDATDALAAAVCHQMQRTDIANDKAYSGWKSFVKNNPGRIK